MLSVRGWHWSEKTAGEQAHLRGWLAGVPKDRHLLLDQSAEMTPVWRFWGEWSFVSSRCQNSPECAWGGSDPITLSERSILHSRDRV